MSISHSDIAEALRLYKYDPDVCRVALDPPGPDWRDITSEIGLPRGVLRDLEKDGLEVYAPPLPPEPIMEKVKSVAAKIVGGPLR